MAWPKLNLNCKCAVIPLVPNGYGRPFDFNGNHIAINPNARPLMLKGNEWVNLEPVYRVMDGD